MKDRLQVSAYRKEYDLTPTQAGVDAEEASQGSQMALDEEPEVPLPNLDSNDPDGPDPNEEPPALNYNPDDPDGPDTRPYVPNEENMPPWGRTQNAKGKKLVPKPRRNKRKQRDAEPQQPMQ